MATQQMTIEEIGKAYRSQNPGAFEGFSDEQIGRRALQRNPSLKQYITSGDKKSPQEDLKPFQRNVDEYLKDFKIGVLKGIVSDVKGASSIGERTLNSILQTALPSSAEKAIGIDEAPNLGIVGRQRGGETSAAQLQADVESRFGLREGALTTASNPAQRTGMMTEQVAGFLLPGSAGLRAGRAAETALKLRNVPKWMQTAGRVGGTAAAEAGLTGGISAIQQGELNGKVATDAALAGGLAGFFGLAGSFLSGAAKKLSFRPKLEGDVIDAGRRLRVKLPASAKTESNVTAQLEALSAKGIWGKQTRQRIDDAISSMNKIADDLVQRAGGKTDLSETGIDIVNSLDEYRNNFFKVKNELYSQASLKGTDIKVTPTKSLPFLQSVLEQKRQAANILGGAKDLQFFENIANALSRRNARGQAQRYARADEVLAAIREINEKLGSSGDNVITGNRATLKKLVTLLSDDMDKAIELSDPQLFAAIEEANTFYREGIDLLNNSTFGKKIQKLREQPDKIVPELFKPNTSIEDMRKAIELIGEENKKSVQATFLEDLFKRSRGNAGDFTPTGLQREIKKFGDDKLSVILDPAQVQSLKDLSVLVQSLNKVGKIAEGSQTAFLGRMFGQMAAIGINPLLGFFSLLGDYGFTKFIGSEVGQKLLSEGFQFTGNIGGAIEKAGPIVGRGAAAVTD